MRLRILELPTQTDVLDDTDLKPTLEQAQGWSTAARGLGAEGLLIFHEEIDLEQLRDRSDEWPHYTSTYCIHDRHGDCRLACKICRAPCRCSCHDTDPIDTPDRPVARIELEGNPA